MPSEDSARQEARAPATSASRRISPADSIRKPCRSTRTVKDTPGRAASLPRRVLRSGAGAASATAGEVVWGSAAAAAVVSVAANGKGAVGSAYDGGYTPRWRLSILLRR